MNTKKFRNIVLLALALIVSVVGVAYAQGPNSPETAPAYGMDIAYDGETGVMHEIIVAVFADKIGISTEEVELKLESGLTLMDIALEYGYTAEDFTVLMSEVQEAAWAEAEAQGLVLGRGGRWLSDEAGMYGIMQQNATLQDGECLSVDGEPLFQNNSFEHRGGRNQ